MVCTNASTAGGACGRGSESTSIRGYTLPEVPSVVSILDIIIIAVGLLTLVMGLLGIVFVFGAGGSHRFGRRGFGVK